jgi:hypothetical protein
MSEFVMVKRELLEILQSFLSDAFDGGLEGLLQEDCGNHIDELRAVLAQEAGKCEPVVLPERKGPTIHQTDESMGFDFGWNACLDKVKELNQ